MTKASPPIFSGHEIRFITGESMNVEVIVPNITNRIFIAYVGDRKLIIPFEAVKFIALKRDQE